jgi:hypothetical protein
MKRTNGFKAEDKKKPEGKELTFHSGRIIPPSYLFPHESNSKQKTQIPFSFQNENNLPNYLQSKKRH